MKIALFGASGRTGKELLFQSLVKGYEINALVRNPDSLDIRSEKLRIIQGDARDPEAVEKTIAGTEAVLVALGSRSRKEKDLMQTATVHIVNSMHKHGVKRIIVESSAGLFGSKDSGWLFGNIIRPLFLNNAFKDKVAQMKILETSGLDWVLVRPVMLIDGQKSGKYHVTLDKPAGARISRADVAEFMLAQLKSDKYLRQMPIVSY